MDENLLTLLEELSLRASYSEDETISNNKDGINGIRTISTSDYTSSSCVSSPAYDQLESINANEEDVELKSAVNSLFQELSTPQSNSDPTKHQPSPGYDKSKLLVALLGNIDLVTCAIKRINHLVSLGKKMEQIYRQYYANPNVALDLDELERLIAAFSQVYQSESYVREVNVSRVYQAYCRKLIDICEARRGQNRAGSNEESMAVDQI